MKRNSLFLGLALLLLAIAGGLPGQASAGEPNQAGLVIQFGDGRIETRCVAFQEDEITGAELLTRSGLTLSVDASTGMGITVCQIEGEGCGYPAEPCFCQCMGGGDCAYWNYYFRDPGATGWSYSALGAVLRKVNAGSVEGWVWGDGSSPPSAEVTYETICLPPTAAPNETTEPTAPPTPTATAVPAGTASPTRAATAPPTAMVPQPSPSPSPAPQTGQSPASYWPFGLAVLGLGLIGAIVWLRRR